MRIGRFRFTDEGNIRCISDAAGANSEEEFTRKLHGDGEPDERKADETELTPMDETKLTPLQRFIAASNARWGIRGSEASEKRMKEITNGSSVARMADEMTPLHQFRAASNARWGIGK